MLRKKHLDTKKPLIYNGNKLNGREDRIIKNGINSFLFI